MNQNPWYVEGVAQYERERIQSDMKQIRLAEKAIKAGQMEEKPSKVRAHRPGLLMRVVLTTLKLLVPGIR